MAFNSDFLKTPETITFVESIILPMGGGRPAVMSGSLHFPAPTILNSKPRILAPNLVNAPSLAQRNDQSVFPGRNMPRSCWTV